MENSIKKEKKLNSPRKTKENLDLMMLALSFERGFYQKDVSKLAMRSQQDGEAKEFFEKMLRGISPESWDRAESELALAKKNNISVTGLLSEDYPEALKQLSHPPLVLYVWGKLPSGRFFPVGVVGSRRATQAGRRMSFHLASEITRIEGVVVSGLAYGIDICAHQGALSVFGNSTVPKSRTAHPGVAVLGSGLLRIYPPEHREFAEQIVNCGGAVISEFPLHTESLPEHFPRRNRIIAGLSNFLVVVEAAIKSGSLITARLALELGKDVFAFPGSFESTVSQGTNKLIRDGAQVVSGYDDILSLLPAWKKPQEVVPVEERFAAFIAAYLESTGVESAGADSQYTLFQRLQVMFLEQGTIQLDKLFEHLPFDVSAITNAISTLEIEGLITQDEMGNCVLVE